MDGGLHERDFYTWTQVQADALRRLAQRRQNLDAAIDLPHLIEEVEDLGSEQVRGVAGRLFRVLEHLLLLTYAPESPAANHRRGEIRVFRRDAARRFTASMRRLIEPALDRDWRDAVDTVADKLGHALTDVQEVCPFTLDELLDTEADLAALLARLPPRAD